MTSLHRRLLVSAAEDGVVLQPGNGEDTSGKAVQIAYGSGVVNTTATPAQHVSSAEAYGVVGLIDLVSIKYLALITNREEVAQIHGKPVYTITDVTYIPLNSQAVAAGAVEDLEKRAHHAHKTSGYATDDSDHVADGHEQDAAGFPATQPSSTATAASAAKKAVQDVRSFGTFAQKWFSKSNAPQPQESTPKPTVEADKITPEQQQAADQALSDQEASVSDDAKAPKEAATADRDTKDKEQQKTTIDTYSKRILRNARLYYTSKSFFFSYDYNLSSRWSELAQQDTTTPLHARFELDFFWNKHIVDGLIASQQHQFVLPLLQGFVGQRTFDVEKNSPDADPQGSAAAQESSSSKFFVTLISRRSVKRAGLRYLRRGVDELGNVANYVETEQILWSVGRKANNRSYSLVQLRGSIPLFFSQSPYSFKPLPQMFGSETTNREAFRKHFEQVRHRYGHVQVASLVDKHGTEVSIGEAYEKTAQWLDDTVDADQKIGFEWFDFHKECKGMRFDNVSILIKTLQPSLEAAGWGVLEDGKLKSQQKGVLRTNCMDCLDRTNVTQSFVAGWVLQQQMKELGLTLDLSTDMRSIWFNQLWADNGDAISRQYAGTAALKGDFTRTRKRNWTGALSDFSLTLNRYYNNIFGDYFLQTCIDYLLGYIGSSAFDDFETNMMTQDYALDIRRVRQNAIDACIKIVIEDPAETLIGGWTLSCPNKANTLRSLPFEECVLLLTDEALYFCRFDWSSEKVGSFERVNLADINALWRGAYITSALGTVEAEEARNVGFALYYDTHGTATVRTNTRSMDNEKAAVDQNAGKDEAQKQAEPQKDQRRLLAFKMLHSSAFVSKKDVHDADESEAETAKKISNAIADAMITAIRKARGLDHLGLEQVPTVEEKAIISLADAKKSTSYVESIGYSLKKMVW